MMQVAFYLLCGFALLGGIDVGYYHLYRFKLYRVPASAAEHLAHLARSALFIAVLSWVMWVKAEGQFALVLPALLAVDFINSMVDVWIEPASRAALGGLPAREYAIHMMTMFVSGALMAVVIVESVRAWALPTALEFQALPLPLWARGCGLQLFIVTAGLYLFEGVQFARAVNQRVVRRSKEMTT